MSTSTPFTTVGPVSVQIAEAVHQLVAECTRHDGVAPISEQPLLQMSNRAAHVAHSFVLKNNALIAYAQIDLGEPGRATAEMAVAPTARGTGIGRQLLRACISAAEQNDAKLAVWAYGNLPAARHLLEGASMAMTRELLLLEAPLIPIKPRVVSGANQAIIDKIRTFRPGVDDEAWLKTNANAFAWHPEQSRLSQDDLDARKAEPWFDPRTFFILDAEDATEAIPKIAAFSWLKIQAWSTSGEIYVVGVDPSVQGQGVGRALMLHSLNYLTDLGLKTAQLYVDADNGPALALYLTQGFAVAQRHGQYTVA